MLSKQERIERFILVWVQHTNDYPDITLNDWLKTFGVLTGVAMNLADLDERLVDKAVDAVSEVAKKAFLESRGNFKPGTLQ
jgi:hypothetical protein